MDIKFNTIEELLEDLKAGKNIVMIDDEDREMKGMLSVRQGLLHRKT